jgi:hypothetical protein
MRRRMRAARRDPITSHQLGSGSLARGTNGFQQVSHLVHFVLSRGH